jgi:polysaccharide biosynthesis transport protein
VEVDNKEPKRKDLRDVVSFLRRRRWQILVPAGVLFCLAAITALALPAAYRSSATILIEEQGIPPDLVRSTITSYADQRIQVISQQVMTRANMMEIIRKFDLYKRLQARGSTESVIEKLRDNIKLETVSAEVIDKRSGNKTAATIAFTLAYEGETPEQAQRVVNELVSLYLNENLKNRQQKAADTSKFLGDEANKLGEQIMAMEKNLATFKQKNIGRLPELSQLNLQMRDRAEAELSEGDRQISELTQRKTFLEVELAQLKPHAPAVSATGERMLEGEDRLRILKSQYASAASQYAPDHPDVQRLKREIEGLERESTTESADLDQAREADRLRAELTRARQRYSEQHPDVMRLRSQLAALAETDGKQPRRAPDAARRLKADNPAYLATRAQLDAANGELATARGRQNALRTKIADYEKRLHETPLVEREYLDLRREYENVSRRYQEVKAKVGEAQVAEEMERDRKGERFSLIDAPDLPEKPVRPNRIAILVMGSVLSLGGGFAHASMREAMDHAIRGARYSSTGAGVDSLHRYARCSSTKGKGSLDRRGASRAGGLVGAAVGRQFLEPARRDLVQLLAQGVAVSIAKDRT